VRNQNFHCALKYLRVRVVLCALCVTSLADRRSKAFNTERTENTEECNATANVGKPCHLQPATIFVRTNAANKRSARREHRPPDQPCARLSAARFRGLQARRANPEN